MASDSSFFLHRVDPEEICENAVRYLDEVVRSRPQGRSMANGVAAAGKLIDWSIKMRSPERAFLALFSGDPAAAGRWLVQNRERLLVAFTKNPQLSEMNDGDPAAEQGCEGREDAGEEDGAGSGEAR